MVQSPPKNPAAGVAHHDVHGARGIDADRVEPPRARGGLTRGPNDHRMGGEVDAGDIPVEAGLRRPPRPTGKPVGDVVPPGALGGLEVVGDLDVGERRQWWAEPITPAVGLGQGSHPQGRHPRHKESAGHDRRQHRSHPPRQASHAPMLAGMGRYGRPPDTPDSSSPSRCRLFEPERGRTSLTVGGVPRAILRAHANLQCGPGRTVAAAGDMLSGAGLRAAV